MLQIKTSGSSMHSMEMVKYNILKASLLTCIKAAVLISFADLLLAVTIDLKKHKHIIFGKLGWHLAWVTLHLENQHKLCRVKSGATFYFSVPTG